MGKNRTPGFQRLSSSFLGARVGMGRREQEFNTADPSQTTWSKYPTGSQRDGIS